MPLPNCGLENQGNTCYIASVVQILVGVFAHKQNAMDLFRTTAADSAASEFARGFCNLVCSICDNNVHTVVPQVTQLVETLFSEPSGWTKAPYNAKKGCQESADEFLQFVLGELPHLANMFTFSERTLGNSANTVSTSDVEDSVEVKSTTLSVPLPSTNVPLSALIHAQYAGSDIANPVVLSEFNDVLVVIIKRWQLENGHIMKNDGPFSLSEPLEIFDQQKINIGQFKLSGFVVHEGASPHHGHYTAFSERNVNDKFEWMYFDDKKTSIEARDSTSQVRATIFFVLSA